MRTLLFGKRLGLVLALLFTLSAALSAQFTLTTTFAAGNGQSGNMFDIEAVNPVLINSFDVHMRTAGNVSTYEVYYKTSRTSYVGSETNAADWTLLASQSATGAGTGLPTPLNLNLAFAMAPGEKIGFYVVSTGTTVGYTNGTSLGAVYTSDANLIFYEGVGKAYPFGGTFTPRIFNGNIHYNLAGGGFADDLACFSVDSPSDAAACSTLSNAETVTFSTFNLGSNAIGAGGSFTADLVLDGTIVTTEPFTTIAGIPQFASETFSFTTTLDLSAGGPRTIDVVINYAGDQDLSNNTGSIAIDAGAPNDIACASVDSPLNAGACGVSSNAETVSFTVNNLGSNSLTIGTAFTADLILDGSLITTEAFTVLAADILCGGSSAFTFVSTLDLSAGGTRTIDVSLTYGGDVNPLNDSASRSVNAGAPDDLAASSVDGPGDAVGCNVLSNAEMVPFTVTNLGANTILIGSSFSATLTHNGSAVATENFTVLAADILCAGSASFTFAATVDLSAGGAQTLDVAVSYAGDVQPGNDSTTLVVNASGPGGAIVNTYPYAEDFETFGTGTGNSATSPIQNGWQQDPNDGTGTTGDWWFGIATSSSLSGPETNGLGDHTSGTGRFAHIEDSGTANPVINFWSPCFDLTGLTNPNIRLWVHSHHFNGGGHFNPIHVDLLTSGGTITSIASVLADTGDAWTSISASLVPYIGQVVQFQIRGDNSAGLQYCDSSIDDFSIFEQAVLSGQAPQAGVATLDINGAINANTNMVASGDNGPYAANVTQNGFLSCDIGGEAGAGILLIGGPLNVQVATYPGFGQFDIGLLPLNAGGVPGTGLFVWADGITVPMVGLNQFFVISPSGTTRIDLGIPVLPLGTLTTFQCINTNSVQIIGFSNAVEVTVVP